MDLPKRKHPRLKEYDYSQNGCFFITFCIKHREHLLNTINVGRDALIPQHTALTSIGAIVNTHIQNINSVYDNVLVDKYVIMPNHVHMLISIISSPDGGGMRASRPTLHTIMRSLKTMVTRQIGYSVWQDSYHDHIIRNEQEYQKIWEYIDTNPLKWEADYYYSKSTK